MTHTTINTPTLPTTARAMAATTPSPSSTLLLTEEQVRTFLEDGVLVVDGVLSPDQVREDLEGVGNALRRRGVETDPSDPTDVLAIHQKIDDDGDNAAEEQRTRETARCLSALSSTNGSGGVLDVFYEPFQMAIATNETLFRMTSQLWQASLVHDRLVESPEQLPEQDRFRWHPFGPFDPSIGYSYIDRMGYRIPTKQAVRLGQLLENDATATTTDKAAGSAKKKAKNRRPIQRSLTPHLDCCPEDRFRGRKWRPIQCFISLTDALEPDTGGFEAATGFHRDFDAWTRRRPPTVVVRKSPGDGTPEVVEIPAPCVGEYTHIRPKEDRDVLERVKHVPVGAGSAVFWDHRIPHANAYRHLGESARCVVYTSFLPDVELNRRYVRQQLYDLKRGRQPTDTWIQATRVAEPRCGVAMPERLNPIQRCLLGLEDWSTVLDTAGQDKEQLTT